MAYGMAITQPVHRRSHPKCSDPVNVYREIDGRLVSVYEREKYVIRYEWVVERWEHEYTGDYEWVSKNKPTTLNMALQIMLQTRNHPRQKDVHFRLRNVKTHEVIPAEAIV